MSTAGKTDPCWARGQLQLQGDGQTERQRPASHLQGVPRYDQCTVMFPSKGVQLQMGLPPTGDLHERGRTHVTALSKPDALPQPLGMNHSETQTGSYLRMKLCRDSSPQRLPQRWGQTPPYLTDWFFSDFWQLTVGNLHSEGSESPTITTDKVSRSSRLVQKTVTGPQ